MTRPVETRMSPLGARVGEGARVRRIGGWKLYGLLALLFAPLLGGLFAPAPFDIVSAVAFVGLAVFIAWRADT
jgi:hypothetical protein